jgi:hypothetical protein
MKKIAIMQPYFFPYLGYWQLYKSVDLFVIFDDVNYIKKGFINRNFILLNGEKRMITLELSGASQNRVIKEIELGRNRTKLYKTIEYAYKRAPYSSSVLPLLREIFTGDETKLVDFLKNSIMSIGKFLDIDTPVILSSSIDKKENLRGKYKIIEICKKKEYFNYINPIGGMKLYNKDEFLSEGIELSFLQSGRVVYRQFSAEFVENLSIIDILMFNSKEKVKSFLEEYTLI